jgi:uncharacterized SAM-binding protein YcdF (DUF218 family)
LSAPGSSLRRTFFRTLLIVGLITLALVVYGALNVGRFLTKEDSIHKADVIAVLAGTQLDRPLEAIDLYKAGYAPSIVLTHETPERALGVVARRGVTLLVKADEARDAMIKLGVPESAIILPARIHDNTAQEAQTLHELARQRGWHRIIVVTSPYHLRRAGFAIRRELKGTGVAVEMRGTRYEPANPARWWTSREDVRWVIDEVSKLVAYELGLGA